MIKLSKRELKRKGLIRDLYRKLLDDCIDKKYHRIIKFRINNKINLVAQTVCYSKNTRILTGFNNSVNSGKLIKSIIVINLKSLENECNNGYKNVYYQGRADNLNFVIHNKKLGLKFVLLHEIRHTRQRIENLQFKSKGDREFDSDNFAINYLRENGDLKQEDLK